MSVKVSGENKSSLNLNNLSPLLPQYSPGSLLTSQVKSGEHTLLGHADGTEQTLCLRQDSLISYRERKDDKGTETGERL